MPPSAWVSYLIMPTIKPLRWIASTKRDIAAMPRNVQDLFGYALHLAQTGKKHSQAKPSSGFGGAGVLEVVETHQGRHTEARNRPYQSAPGYCRSAGKESSTMRKIISGVIVKESSGNPYADVGLPDADEMLAKAMLASKLEDQLYQLGMTPTQAAELVDVPIPWLTNLLLGKFRDISRDKIIACLAQLKTRAP
jgi:predicted XRE-type DNA-binding protein